MLTDSIHYLRNFGEGAKTNVVFGTKIRQFYKRRFKQNVFDFKKKIISLEITRDRFA